MLPDFLDNLRIGIVGFGVNNQALTRWLVDHGASEITVYDENPQARNNGRTLNVQWILGKGAFAQIDADIIYKSPGIPFDRAEIIDAQKKGIVISSQTELFLRLCPSKIIGVTGTKGKGTTSTLISKILEEHVAKNNGKVYLAGNIGRDPFEFLDEVKVDDIVVLELSSFQLENIKESPDVAVVLGITADHLDYHHTLTNYHDAKTGIVRNQTKNDIAIFNLDSETTLAFAELAQSQIYYYSITKSVDRGVFLKNNAFYWREDLDEAPQVVAYINDINLPGAHNLSNIAAALTATLIVGAKLDSIIPAIKNFNGLAHRLEKIGEKRGIAWYNDSASTNVSTTIAAIESFMERKILIAGGSDKGLDYMPLGKIIANSNVGKLIIMGTTGPKIAQSAQVFGYDSNNIIEVTNLDDAIKQANDSAMPGDVVILSPASASFDMFANYVVRGDHFRALVKSRFL